MNIFTIISFSGGWRGGSIACDFVYVVRDYHLKFEKVVGIERDRNACLSRN